MKTGTKTGIKFWRNKNRKAACKAANLRRKNAEKRKNLDK